MNLFVMSWVVPKPPIIAGALNTAVEKKNRGHNDIVWLSTGFGLFTRAFVDSIKSRIQHGYCARMCRAGADPALHRTALPMIHDYRHWSQFQKHINATKLQFSGRFA
jgi:hypothetical protein